MVSTARRVATMVVAYSPTLALSLHDCVIQAMKKMSELGTSPIR
jgi:hypothetical protein